MLYIPVSRAIETFSAFRNVNNTRIGFLDSPVSSSLVGLAIAQSMVLTAMVQYGLRQAAEVITQLTSVERVMEYTKIDTEGPFDTPEGKSFIYWVTLVIMSESANECNLISLEPQYTIGLLIVLAPF